ENTRIGGADLKVTLVSVHDEIPSVLAAILQTGVAPIAAEFVREANLDIAINRVRSILLKNQEIVPFSRVFFARLAGDDAVFDRPVVRSPSPAGEVLAIDEALKTRLRLLRRDVQRTE